MTPIQQLMLGVGVSKKTYLDDVFSTYLYKGNGGSLSINNGINLSGDGGMTWLKNRGQSYGNVLYDTVRGAGTTKSLVSNDNNAEGNSSAYANLSSFNSNGFTIGTTSSTNVLNQSNHQISSWSFRKSKGFFDVVTWTGNSDTNQTISHSLKSRPGMIIAKRTDSSTTGDWVVYHRDHAGYLKLNSSNSAVNDSGAWTPVTSSSFKAYDYINVNGASYVAYVFAGGESTAATARSVDFDGSDDRLTIPDNDAWDLGTGDFTFECWVKGTQAHTSYVTVAGSFGAAYKFMIRWSSPDVGTGWSFFPDSGVSSTRVFGKAINDNQWHHLAVVRDGTKISTYTDGIFNNSITSSSAFNNAATPFEIGHRDSGEHFNGKISNLRLVKGTAVYTSSFKPPTAPLENITNTVLLCCNNSSATGSTVTPDTITANSSPTASTDSPFDDPAGFKFGDAGDQNVIKCGSYDGTGAAGHEIYLGWEPQWLMIKNADGANTDWYMIDMMRGSFALGDDDDTAQIIKANDDAAEFGTSAAHPTSTGFRLTSSYSHVNHNTHTYVYVAIRRKDGYVGKPIETATSVFAMDTGSSSSTIPTYDSGFPVAFALWRTPAAQGNWNVGARLIGNHVLSANLSAAEQDDSNGQTDFDSNLGFGAGGGLQTSSSQAWMWKRHAGFDVVTYEGNGVGGGRQIPHSLNKAPEMIWVKNRDSTTDWNVYHKGLDGGTNPEQKYLVLNTDAAEADNVNRWNDTAPTSTFFTIGDSGRVNTNAHSYIAMLFASVDGISSVGSFTGSGSSRTITVGFQPRFIILKNTSRSNGWITFDTVRGWGSGADAYDTDAYIWLNDNAAQVTGGFNVGAPTSTGFSLHAGDISNNQSGDNYIYYAHA